jgi:hypothetical protein
MAKSEHVYDIPDAEELAALVGAATPHFALQAHHRIARLVESLPSDHPRQPELREQLARLERIAREGESGGRSELDLPTGPSLTA